MELGYRGQVYRLTVAKIGRDRYRVELDGRYVDVDVDRLSPLESRLAVGGRAVRGRSRRRAAARTWSRSTASPTGSPGTRRAWCARRRRPSSSRSGSTVGQEVEAGQTIVVLESMKMETAVRAPFAGRVREVLAAVNAQVDAGAAAAAPRPRRRRGRGGRPASGSTLPRRPTARRRADRGTGRCRCSPRCRR